MLRNCDCGACCEQCGHYPDCIRHERGDDDTEAPVSGAFRISERGAA